MIESIKKHLKNNYDTVYKLLKYFGYKEISRNGEEIRCAKRDGDNASSVRIKLNDYMEGPNAYLFADSIIEPIKVVSKFIKEHPALEVRVGYIDSEFADSKVIAEYATIPSMEGLLTMFAGGLMEHVRNLSIGLNLYAEKLEEGGNN